MPQISHPGNATMEQTLQRKHDAAALYLGGDQLRRYDELLDRERRNGQVNLKLWVAQETSSSSPL